MYCANGDRGPNCRGVGARELPLLDTCVRRRLCQVSSYGGLQQPRCCKCKSKAIPVKSYWDPHCCKSELDDGYAMLIAQRSAKQKVVSAE